jgi:hypothetical protein
MKLSISQLSERTGEDRRTVTAKIEDPAARRRRETRDALLFSWNRRSNRAEDARIFASLRN